MNKHTPGPWEVGIATWHENGDVMYSLVGIKEACAPDARLIAAAPEMLDALEAVSDAQGWPFMEDKVADMVLAAIAKARGEACATTAAGA